MHIGRLLHLSFTVSVSALVFGCFQSHPRAEVVGDVGALDASRDAGVRDTSRDAGRDASGRLCGCPGREVRCVLPEMCCPATRTCEDPSRFNCTGSAPRCE
jgi:hypothetical protein